MKDINQIQDFDVKGKRILVRVDLNVPMLHGKIVDAARIERVIPTIKYLVEQQAKVILISHFGRPKGKFDIELSLAPLVDTINDFLDGLQVKFAVDCIGGEAEKAVANLAEGEVLLLENLRFYPGEKKNDAEFVKGLAKLGDIFVNDTFSCSHRDHASITGLAGMLPAAAGLLFAQEIKTISAILAAPKQPFAALVGGSKVSTKLDVLASLVTKTDFLIIGGGMANTFLKAKGYAVGKSLCEEDLLNSATEIIAKAKEHNCQIILPTDVVVASKLENPDDCEIVSVDKVPAEKMILDLGPDSCINLAQILQECKTIMWNGPLGAFEYRPFNIATEDLARTVASLTTQGKLISIAGGGDVVAALKASGLKQSFTYLSTGGGAFLEWLKGEGIYGLQALEKNYKQ